MQKNELKQYFKQIRILFPDFSKAERKFFNDMKNSVEDYVEKYPNSSIDDVMDEFGAPQDIVCDYIESMDIQQVTKRIGTHRIIMRTAIVLLCLALTAFVTFAVSNHLAYLEAINTIITTEQTIIE